VSIGSDVWIGRDVTILAGVTIGHGTVIATGAVITKDVASYSVVGGVPAKQIRPRFGSKVVEKLLRLRWWDWDDETIKERLNLFATPDFEDLLDEFLQQD
jgi:carbonic anhydrase/acetyltransferase-like protein (isoleucine patch superfamily)